MFTIQLYKPQQAIVDKLNHRYQTTNLITQNRYFLSGEMGVGKTYMGAKIAIEQSKQRPVIIVVPNTVAKKWQQVLIGFQPDLNLEIIDQKFCRDDSVLKLVKNKIILIPDTYFNRLFNNKISDQQQLGWWLINKDYNHQAIDFKRGNQEIYQEPIDMRRAYNLRQFVQSQPFLIYDEIHQAQKSKLTCLSELLNRSDAYNRDDNKVQSSLFMTGTIFNVDNTQLNQLIEITNPELLKYQTKINHITPNGIQRNISNFMQYLWQYISVSIALDDVQSEPTEKINQTIAPIDLIQTTPLERSFYELINMQLAANFDIKFNHRQKIAADYLDQPEKPPLRWIEKRKNQHHFAYKKAITLATPLQLIKLDQTKKYQKLIQLLKQRQKSDQIIIYATDKDLIEQLCQNLNQAGYRAKIMPKSIKKADYSHYINQAFQKYQIFIINPKTITVGVDIDANVLIWYQLLSDMTDIIQAQRRIYRLNSTKDSIVYYLAYQLTYQAKLIKQISNAAKNNAASYGVQDSSNLAKYTQILLENIR